MIDGIDEKLVFFATLPFSSASIGEAESGGECALENHLDPQLLI